MLLYEKAGNIGILTINRPEELEDPSRGTQCAEFRAS